MMQLDLSLHCRAVWKSRISGRYIRLIVSLLTADNERCCWCSIPPVSAPALNQKIFDLSDCRISATLPQSIGALSGLRAWYCCCAPEYYLELQRCLLFYRITKGNWGISGTLPSSVGNIQDDSWTFESLWHNSTNATSDLFCTGCGNVSLTHW